MDLEIDEQRSTVSNRYFVRVKQTIALVAFASVLALEIYACVFLTPPSGVQQHQHLNTDKFVCGEDIPLGSSLHVKVCDKVISIASSVAAAASESVNLTETEWGELDKLLRR